MSTLAGLRTSAKGNLRPLCPPAFRCYLHIMYPALPTPVNINNSTHANPSTPLSSHPRASAPRTAPPWWLSAPSATPSRCAGTWATLRSACSRTFCRRQRTTGRWAEAGAGAGAGVGPAGTCRSGRASEHQRGGRQADRWHSALRALHALEAIAQPIPVPFSPHPPSGAAAQRRVDAAQRAGGRRRLPA